jgi:acetylornithine deacetylase/succinyl-diaminopimelate desuccinylase-like protein
VRNTNGSHNPEEHMEMNDFIDGLKVLASSANEIVSQTNWCGADEK